MNFFKNIFEYKAPNKGDGTDEAAAHKTVNVPITFIEDEPTADAQQAAVVEQVTAPKSDSELSEYGKECLNELKETLAAQKIPTDEANLFVEEFISKISSESTNDLVDIALGNILSNSTKRSKELKVRKEAGLKDASRSEVKLQVLEDEKESGVFLENGLYKKQRNAFCEAFDDVVIDPLVTETHEESNLKLVKDEFKRIINVLRKENKLIAKSLETKDVWSALVERIAKEAQLEHEAMALLNVLLAKVARAAASSSAMEQVDGVAELPTKVVEKTIDVEAAENIAVPAIGAMEKIGKLDSKIVLLKNFYAKWEKIIKEFKQTPTEKLKPESYYKNRMKVAVEGLNDAEQKVLEAETLKMQEKIAQVWKLKNLELENERKVSLFEYRVGGMGRSLEIWKTRIIQLDPEKNDDIKSASFYVNKVTDVKKDGISGEQLELLNKEIEKVKSEITEIWKNKKGEFESFKKKNEAQKKPAKIERGENSLERVVDHIERTKEAKIAKIEKGEKDVELLMVTDINVVNISEEDKKEIAQQVDTANSELIKAKKEYLEVQREIQEKKEREIELENDVWIKELSMAIEKLKKMTMTMEEADEKYAQSQHMEGCDVDYSKELTTFLHAHEHDSVDQFTAKEKERFANALLAAKEINDENNPIEVVIINGHTYKFKKEAPTKENVKAEIVNPVDVSEIVEPGIVAEEISLDGEKDRDDEKKVVTTEKMQKKIAAKKKVIIKEIVRTKEEKSAKIEAKEFKLPHVWDSLREHPENFEMILDIIKRRYKILADLMNSDERTKDADKEEMEEMIKEGMGYMIESVVMHHGICSENDKEEMADLKENFFNVLKG